jgi:hypothetical protein
MASHWWGYSCGSKNNYDFVLLKLVLTPKINFMLSTKSLWLALVITTVAMSACRKGDEDPFFSLLSRKARLAGDWQLSTIEGERHRDYVDEDNAAIYTSGDEHSIETIIINTNSAISTVHNSEIIDYSMQIEKDGTWSKTIKLNQKEVIEFSGEKTSTTYPIDMAYTGTWAFVGKTKKNFKNTERIMFTLHSYVLQPSFKVIYTEYEDGSPTEKDSLHQLGLNITYTEDELSNVYEIEMLKAKEMKWASRSINFTEIFKGENDPISGSSYTYDNVAFETIVWKHK